MRRRRLLAAPLLLLLGACAGMIMANGCSATSPTHTFQDGGGTGGTGGMSSSSSTGPSSSSSGHGGTGGDVMFLDSGMDSTVEDVFQDPCDSKCGPVELCDPEYLGLDDDCNGLVDENCGCSAGQAHFCF